jgi:hypothetical protein
MFSSNTFAASLESSASVVGGDCSRLSPVFLRVGGGFFALVGFGFGELCCLFTHPAPFRALSEYYFYLALLVGVLLMAIIIYVFSGRSECASYAPMSCYEQDYILFFYQERMYYS